MSYVCCICHSFCDGWGNNPWPVVKDEDERCCDRCNMLEVIPARLRKHLEESE